MPIDFKKTEKEFYKPPTKPVIVDVPSMKFIVVDGQGSPNEEGGAFQNAIGILYPVAYTLRMSHRNDYIIKDYQEYVVPPLEGYWWQDHIKGYDKTRKDLFRWNIMIRIPDFISAEDVEWAKNSVFAKKKIDCSAVYYSEIQEGLCIQMMHIGPFDLEHESLAIMSEFVDKNGYVFDLSDSRKHHEIYLSDMRRVDPSKMKTVLRHPIKIIE